MDHQKTQLAGLAAVTSWLTQPKILAIGTGILLLYGILSLLLTFGPIVRVEAGYQYRQLLNRVGAQSFLQLIVPQISFSTTGLSQHREFGVVIPALGLNEPVIFNVDATNPAVYNEALKGGIAHAAGTSIPNMGGIGYYFAHSSNPEWRKQFNAVFYLLGKLEGGEDVYIWHESEKYHYKVIRSQVTSPSDVSFLNQEYTTETIVMQTCWPPGTTSKRLLVFAERATEN